MLYKYNFFLKLRIFSCFGIGEKGMSSLGMTSKWWA